MNFYSGFEKRAKEGKINSQYHVDQQDHYDKGKLIGHSTMLVPKDGGLPMLNDIFVYPEHRRKGLGTNILSKIKEKYPHYTAQPVVTHYSGVDEQGKSPTSEALVDFYRKAGFSPIGKPSPYKAQKQEI